MTDWIGQRIGTYSYAADGRVFETQRANAEDHLRFAYATDAQGLPETFVTRYNAQGQAEQQTYNFIAQGHVTRPSALSVPTGQSGYVQNTVYDAKGLKTKHIQQDGRVTFYTRNTKGRITREATYPASFQSATTAPPLNQAESVSSTQWHGKWNLPLKTAEAYLITSYSYDNKSNLLELSETPTTDATGAKGFNATPSGETQTTQWTYDTRNLPSTIVEQSAGVESGRWNFVYYAKGDITQITHVTTGTVATLVPVGNGTSQVTAITQQASPAVNPAMATVRALGFARASTAAAGEMDLPWGRLISVANIIKICSKITPAAVVKGIAISVVAGEYAGECSDKPSGECEEDKARKKDCKTADKDLLKIILKGYKNSHAPRDRYDAKPNARFDICACTDGSVVIRPNKQCGSKEPPTIPTYEWWN